MNSKKFIKYYFNLYKNKFILVILFIFLSVLSYVLSPIIIGKLIDNFGSNNIYIYFIILLILILLYFIFNYLSNIILKRTMLRITNEIRNDFIKKINSLKISNLDKYKSGDITSRIVNDIDFINDGGVEFINQLITSILTIIIIFIIMFSLNITLALVILLFTPIACFIPYYVTKKTKNLYKKQQVSEGKMGSYVKEKIYNYSYIKVNFIEDKIISKFFKNSLEYSSNNRKAVFYSSIANPTSRFLNGIVLVIVCLIGGKYAINGVLTVGTFQVFISYATQFIKPFNELSNVSGELANCLASIDRILEVLNLDSEDISGIHLERTSGKIDFCNVDFSYSKNSKLIEDLSCCFESKKKIAIVGSTGSGKTTLINLLLRFYDLDNGSIKVDNLDIKDLSLYSYRERIGVVLQENYLFSGSILDNIKYGCSNATMDEVIASCKAANCHDFIENLPDGYNTLLDNISLSSGQKQLICIARVILNNPSILILDEATSDIDTLTEVKVQKALDNLMKNRSSIVIAHRLSTIKKADKIIVMDKGNIVEVGKHDELLSKKGYYYSIYNSQFLDI
ncbi:MAG: ABC transporter ATP-binding protein [Firmicutes bacterium]|nr:ABC transporter ATP-binding protein [Bacillota bacterium]